MKVFGIPGGTLCTDLNYDQHHEASPISQGLIRTAIFIFERGQDLAPDYLTLRSDVWRHLEYLDPNRAANSFSLKKKKLKVNLAANQLRIVATTRRMKCEGIEPTNLPTLFKVLKQIAAKAPQKNRWLNGEGSQRQRYTMLSF